jgi:hypothetical protein
MAPERQNAIVQWFRNSWERSCLGTNIFRSTATPTITWTHWGKPSNNLVIPANMRRILLQTCVSVVLKKNIWIAKCVKKTGSGHLCNSSKGKGQGHTRHFLDPITVGYLSLLSFYMRNSACTIQLILLVQSKQKIEKCGGHSFRSLTSGP